MNYLDRDAPPKVTPPQLVYVPPDLRDLSCWVLWRYDWVEKDGEKAHWAKVPYHPRGYKAAVNKPSTWSSFDAVVQAYKKGNYSGVGFVFSPAAGICGVDLDGCLTEEEGEHVLTDFAKSAMARLTTYCEISPSGNGLHFFALAQTDDHKALKNPEIEIYFKDRFFTFTGICWGDQLSVEDCTDAILSLRDEALSRRKSRAKEREPQEPREYTDHAIPADELLQKAFNAANGAAIQRLYCGDTSGYASSENDGHSEADLALCNHLAFWCQGNSALLDQWFRASALMRPKWDERRGAQTYGEMTIEKAINGCSSTYNPNFKRETETQKPSQGAPEGEWEEDSADWLNQRHDWGYTDDGMLNRFAERQQQNFRYIPERDDWLSWDGTKWDQEHGSAYLWQTIGQVALECESEEEPSAKDPEKCQKFFARYRSSTGKRSLVETARHDMRLRLSEAELDTNAWLLNCANGTLDLRTGELLPFQRTHYLTHKIAVPYDPKAKCDEWDTFLVNFSGKDKDLRAFILAWLFYCLSADTSAQVFVAWQGKPNSGKGTMARVMQALLGKQLAREAARGAFCHKEYDNVSHQDFLAQLKGRRFVIQSEFEDKKLDTGLIKQVTGQDSIYASAKGKSGQDYVPTYKLNLFSNLPPIFNVEDEALIRRLRVIPCDYVPSTEEIADKQFEARLHQELPGILANLLSEGRELFFKQGLGKPDKMQDRIAVISEAQNPFREWFQAIYEVPTAEQIEASRSYPNDKYPIKVKRSEINSAYSSYCRENGYKEIGRQRKLATLLKLGVEEKKIGGDFYFVPVQKQETDE